MILSFTAIDTSAQFRDFFCQFAELETALDFLGTITSQGDTILKAHIIDDDKRTELSPEAFDGQPFTQPLHQLEKQWQVLLSDPMHLATPDTSWRIDFARQQIKLYDNRIAVIRLAISQIELLWQRAEESIQHESRRIQLIDRYRQMLIRHQQQINQMQAAKQQVQKKLNQLESCLA